MPLMINLFLILNVIFHSLLVENATEAIRLVDSIVDLYSWVLDVSSGS